MNTNSESDYTGVLTREAIFAYLEKPLPDRLFISPLLDRKQVGVSSIDLRLGLDFKITQKSSLSVIDLTQEKSEVEAAIQRYQKTVHVNLTEPFVLHPNQGVLANSLEYIRLPGDLMSYVVSRSSWARLAVQVNPAAIFPGFAGTVTLVLLNQGDVPVILRPGFRIAQLILHKLSGVATDTSRYMYATEAAFSRIHLDTDLSFFGPSVEPVIVGVVSTIGAGRSTVINYLMDERGFKPFSLSEIVKKEARDRGLDQIRGRLQDVGNSLRQSYGNDILARRMVTQLSHAVSEGQYIVLDGIKHPEEVLELRKKRHFFLVAINAPAEVRFERILARRRHGDPKTLDEFRFLDERDKGITEPDHGQHVSHAMELADFTIENTGSLDELKRKTEIIVKRILGENN